MMRLFGGYGPACYDAYQARHPLAPGWPDRVALHQIAPLVVHAVKFGGGYGPAARAAIERYA
jgi:fructosamine-3-kinase